MSFAITHVGSALTLISTRRKDQQNDLIPITVRSDRTSPDEFIRRLYYRKVELEYTAREAINSMKFEPTFGVWGNLIILKGRMFRDEERMLPIIRMTATELGFGPLNLENACLVQDRFSHRNNLEAMGLTSIMLMHNPLSDFERNKLQLCVMHSDDATAIRALPANDSLRWHIGLDYVFEVIQP